MTAGNLRALPGKWRALANDDEATGYEELRTCADDLDAALDLSASSAPAETLITESCGNVFADLGFPPGEAKVLIACSEAKLRAQKAEAQVVALQADLEALSEQATQLENDREYNAELVRERDVVIATLQAERDRLASAIRWALGEEGDFPPMPELEPGKPRRTYYWRTELRKRAALSGAQPDEVK